MQSQREINRLSKIFIIAIIVKKIYAKNDLLNKKNVYFSFFVLFSKTWRQIDIIILFKIGFSVIWFIYFLINIDRFCFYRLVVLVREIEKRMVSFIQKWLLLFFSTHKCENVNYHLNIYLLSFFFFSKISIWWFILKI